MIRSPLRRYRAPFRALDTSFAVRFWVACTTSMFGFDLRQAQAAEAGFSVRYLQKVFAARATTFGHFIRSLRLDHAAQLLRQQTSIKASLPLTEVAYACGYRDYAHFARNFRARLGCAPGASRGWISSGRGLKAGTWGAEGPFGGVTRRRTLHASLWRMDDVRGLACFPAKSANHGIERRGKQETEPRYAQHARENGGA